MNDRIFVAVGSSIGDAESLFESAEKWLRDHGVEVIKKSQNHKFPPYGGVARREFTNAVWELQWFPPLDKEGGQGGDLMEAEALLQLLLQCEKAHDRIREVKWADRTLDLDLLIYKDVECHTETLTLPHPEMEKRDFVQIPLQEIL